jgi:hypothetical protein
MLRRVVWLIFTDVSEVLTASIISALMMEAVSTTDRPVNIHQITLRNITDDSHILTRRREDLKSHQIRNPWGCAGIQCDVERMSRRFGSK